MKSVADTLSTSDHPVSDEDLLMYILGGVVSEYDAIVVYLTSRSEFVSLQDVQYLLQVHGMRMKQLCATSSIDFGLQLTILCLGDELRKLRDILSHIILPTLENIIRVWVEEEDERVDLIYSVKAVTCHSNLSDEDLLMYILGANYVVPRRGFKENQDSPSHILLLTQDNIFRVLLEEEDEEGPKATALCSGIVIISEYCKGNSSVVKYPLGLKLIGLHIEDISFTTDQTKHYLEVGNTSYESYDSSAKRRLLVSLGLFFCIYYKGGMLGEHSASLPRASILTEG
ncbi:Retrovirus-related Pol polyprotein from transposon TNT 1-94 [Forsythia ovata]|uniref:Retrovirus-related Pol polyprotein from transposon TNT 1-94 n=1 Tax=Forsythia ovata TaxID=205694 RepID=A0ABD1PL15_9LAMI